MHDAAAFQQAFGAALAGRTEVADPALARALAVHRNTAAKAARDALADNFPVTRALVGADAFDGAAAAFVAERPPAEPRLCLYGHGFPGFLAGHAPFVELTYLSDLATVERIVVEALFAADAPPLDATAFADGVDLARPLHLHTATRFAAFASPAGSIWQAHAPDADADALDEIAWGEELVLVTRPGAAVIVSVLPVSAAAFLQGCAAGVPLGETAASVSPDELAHLFPALIGAGAFA